MNKKPYILITNDDGINAEGIRHLYEALKDFGNCIISAPHSEKSGCGLATTLTTPLQIQNVNWDEKAKAYQINGTPADCVKLALHTLTERKPDLIVSGINKGSNAGRNLLYSGTVGAVIEGVYNNIPGIAFSCFELKNPDYEQAKKYIVPIVEYVLKNPLETGSFLNVNFPSKKFENYKGLKLGVQGYSFFKENPDKRIHPEGHDYYWMSGKWLSVEEPKNSDVYYIENGFVAAVPINLTQLGCEKQLNKHRAKFEKII